MAGAVALVIVSSSAAPALAQDKYSVFIGQYAAAQRVVADCDGFSLLAPQSAASVAKSEDGLRRQKVLRLMYYSKSAKLAQLGNATLTARGVDAASKRSVCRFGKAVVGKDDRIGRFLALR